MRPHLVIFDLGRVLIRICDTMHQASLRAGNKFVPADLPPYAKSELVQLSHRADLGQMDELQIVSRLGPLFNMPPGEARAMFEHFLMGPYPGVGEFLSELRDAGYATACLSNTNAAHWRLMSTPGTHATMPLDILTYRFGSHLMRLRKPDPAIYQAVERHTGFTPAQITFFDDLPENVDSAAQCGWNAILVPHVDDTVSFLRQHVQLP